jgi:hypothetical protein
MLFIYWVKEHVAETATIAILGFVIGFVLGILAK